MSFLSVVMGVDHLPVLELRNNDSPEFLQANHEVFFEIPLPPTSIPFVGFYDWLRSPATDIIGVQVIFHDHRELAKREIQRSGIGEWLSEHIYRITFISAAKIDETISVDQEFSVSRIYKSHSTRRLAMLFDADGVEDQLQRVLKHKGV